MSILLTINNNQIVSVDELNQILDYVERTSPRDLDIYFENSIQKIDIVFIAGLILCNQQNNTKFEITYREFAPERLFEIRHYLKQFQEVFGQNWNNIFSKFQGITVLSETDYFASKSFAPILLITEDSIDSLFRKSEIGTELFDLCQKYINDDLSKKNQSETAYLNSERSIIKILPNFPPIYTFVFKVLYNKIAPFVRSTSKGIEDPAERTEELWEFSKEYVRGIHELAKNIVEHSDTKRGMITIRAYEEDEADRGNVLETHVFDFGKKGIISNLLEETAKNKATNKIYEDDLEILNGPFLMKDFIKPNIETKLNQQLYRDLAHYGLMKFHKLIERNKGIIVSSSNGKDGKRDSYLVDIQSDEKAISIGTSYFFQLPFKHELFKSVDSGPSSADMQGSSEIISGLSELMNFRVVKHLEDLTDSRSEKEKVIWCPELKADIKNRDHEADLIRPFRVLRTEERANYVALDMKEVALSASSLLRFLAHLSSNYKQPIMAFNLNFELYGEMISDNEEFYRSVREFAADIPYWYENKGILIFSRLEEINFNFADLLYGDNPRSFRTINHIVSHTFPNTASIGRVYESNGEVFEIPNCIKSFFYQSSLLPFDLLLCNEDLKTMFQSNLETLLSQELAGIEAKLEQEHGQN